MPQLSPRSNKELALTFEAYPLRFRASKLRDIFAYVSVRTLIEVLCCHQVSKKILIYLWHPSISYRSFRGRMRRDFFLVNTGPHIQRVSEHPSSGASFGTVKLVFRVEVMTFLHWSSVPFLGSEVAACFHCMTNAASRVRKCFRAILHLGTNIVKKERKKKEQLYGNK